MTACMESAKWHLKTLSMRKKMKQKLTAFGKTPSTTSVEHSLDYIFAVKHDSGSIRIVTGTGRLVRIKGKIKAKSERAHFRVTE